MVDLLRPPNIGEWSRDSYTGDYLYTFRCSCGKGCKEVFVIRCNKRLMISIEKFSLDTLALLVSAVKNEKTKNPAEKIVIKLDGPLSVVASRKAYSSHFEKSKNLRRLNKRIREFNESHGKR